MVFDGAMPLVLLLSVADSSPLVFGIVASLGFIVSLLVVLRFRYQVTPFSSYFRETATALFRSDLRWRKQFTYYIINRLASSTARVRLLARVSVADYVRLRQQLWPVNCVCW